MRDEILNIQNALKVDLQFYKDCHSCIPVIIDVCKKFDGKVLNKRFTNAMKEATTGKFSANNWSYVWGGFSTRFSEKVFEIQVDAHGYLYFSFLCCYEKHPDWDTFFAKSPGGKDRLVADSVIKEIEKRDAALSQKIIDIEKSIPKIEEYIDTYNEMIDNIEKYVKSIPTDVSDHIGKSYLCRSLIYKLR